jgi:predicted nucleic acid-binding protein
MKPKIYIETSVVSYYTNRPSRDIVTAARQQVTREWWEESLNQFDTYISALVLEEASGGDPTSAERRLEALKGIPVLKITDEAEDLAAALVKIGPIPETHSEDALHVALAIINGMDFLVTWNFHHINNAKMKKEIAKIAEENGYECPVICSPEELEGE